MEPESSSNVKSLILVSFFRENLELNQISSDLLALSWSLVDEHQFATSDIQSWSTRLAWTDVLALLDRYVDVSLFVVGVQMISLSDLMSVE